jgi:hypothetical protein
MSPTPELAPWISTLSPALSRPLVTTASCMVSSASESDPATSKLMPAGIGITRPQSQTAYSA